MNPSRALLRLTLLSSLLFFGSAGSASAHGGNHDVIEIGSEANGGGALKTTFDFNVAVRTSLSAALPGVTLYTASQPSFDVLPADDPLDPIYVLNNGVTVRFEVLAVDAGRTAIKIGSTVLDEPGESEVIGTQPFSHLHPEIQLVLQMPPGEFGEGRITFRLTTTSPAYSDSEPYTLVLTNGHLKAPGYADVPGVYDADGVSCTTTAAKESAKFGAKKHQILSACLANIQVRAAREAAGLDATAADAAVENACAKTSGPDSGTMLGKIEAARAKAIAKIAKKCGAAASNDYSDDEIGALVGLVGCRAEEEIAAAYHGARSELEELTARASQGGQPLDESFPCMPFSGQ